MQVKQRITTIIQNLHIVNNRNSSNKPKARQ